MAGACHATAVNGSCSAPYTCRLPHASSCLPLRANTFARSQSQTYRETATPPANGAFSAANTAEKHASTECQCSATQMAHTVEHRTGAGLLVWHRLQQAGQSINCLHACGHNPYNSQAACSL